MSRIHPSESENIRKYGGGVDQFPVPSATGNPWKTCLSPLLEEDRLRCEAWRDEVQNLLLFAGLFSAVVTAFVVQSYQYLQPSSSGDTTTLLLAIIAQNTGTPGLSRRDNGTEAPMTTPSASYYPSASTVRVNICWFMSLILSLMTVLVGIVALQWIREYQRYPSNLPAKRAFAARNLRMEGLEQWYVPEIFAGLPLLLQSSLVLFLVGLTDFLLHLNIVVAWPAIAMTSATLLFLIITTILPPIQALWVLNKTTSTTLPAPCPYKSPQSWAFFRFLSSWSFRCILNFFGDSAFHLLLAPVSAIALIEQLIGGRQRLWMWISYLHVTLKLKSLGSLRDWSEFDGFWMDERQRLYIRSSEPSAYFTKTIGNTDCDAARGIAHVVDGRAGEDPIAVAIYHCFQELPGNVIGDDVFKLMTQRLPQWMTAGQAKRTLNKTCLEDSKEVKEENELFLLARLPQTSIVEPIHFFRRRQLQIFVRVLRHVFSVGRSARSSSRAGRQLNTRPDDTGKLLIPTCMKTVQRITALPQPLLTDILDQLVNVFEELVHKTISTENEPDCTATCLPSERTLGDFMQLMQVVTMSLLKMTRESPTAGRATALSSLTTLIDIMNQSIARSSRPSRRPAVHLATMYVSRFEADDWKNIWRSPEFSAPFRDLVESLTDIGLTTYNFALHRAFYRKRCEDLVHRIKGGVGRTSAGSEINNDAAIQIVVEMLPKDLQSDDSIEVSGDYNHDPGDVMTGSSFDAQWGVGPRPRYPERAKLRCPTVGMSGRS